MSTTPPTKACENCNGTGYTCLNAYHTIPDDPDCIKCTTCHGTGVVAAEADHRTVSPNYDGAVPKETPAPTAEQLRELEDSHFGPTAEAEKVHETDGKYGFNGDWDRLCVCGHPLGVHSAPNDTGKRPCFNEDDNVWIDEDGKKRATGEACDCPHFKLSRRKAPTPPAATDDEVHRILCGCSDHSRCEDDGVYEERRVALEAHYAARFERAIGEDGDNWPDSEVNGEEDFRQALAEESQNKLRAEARSRYYGEQAGGSDE